MNDNSNFYGYLLLFLIGVVSLVTLGIAVDLWLEAFALGNRAVVFVSGAVSVLVLMVTAVVINRNFKISRRKDGNE